MQAIVYREEAARAKQLSSAETKIADASRCEGIRVTLTYIERARPCRRMQVGKYRITA